jgi:GDP-D-mannose 3', 5'-epimerase
VNRYFEKRKDIDVIFQLARNMGGAMFCFSGDNDAEIMHDSATINLNILDAVKNFLPNVKIFYSSSRCAYPAFNQTDPNNPKCSEDSIYPSQPDSEYGWEKLFSERLYLTYRRNHNIKTYIARFHNCFGPAGTWDGGREKSPAALCRKVCETQYNNNNEIEIWGPGTQTRSFVYVDECVDGILKLVDSEEFFGPVNIGSEEMIAINDLAKMVIEIAKGKDITIKNVPGPVGVMGRNSDNRLIKEKLGWAPSQPLRVGMEKTFKWIKKQVAKKHKKEDHGSATAQKIRQ